MDRYGLAGIEEGESCATAQCVHADPCLQTTAKHHQTARPDPPAATSGAGPVRFSVRTSPLNRFRGLPMSSEPLWAFKSNKMCENGHLSKYLNFAGSKAHWIFKARLKIIYLHQKRGLNL